MKKKFIRNLLECAKATYIKVHSAAKASDFASDKIDKINQLALKSYNSKKPKTAFKDLVCASITLYNNEIIVVPDLAYELYVLVYIVENRIYKLHKFIQRVNQRFYYKCMVPGMKYSTMTNIIEKLMEV